MHIYNVVRQKKDERDLKLGTPTLEELPKYVDLRDKCPPIFDQGDIGSCSSNAGVAARMMLDGIQTELSRLYLYYKERELEDTIGEDSGAQMRDVCKALNKFGVCEEQYAPYIIQDFAKEPSKIADKNAKKYTISAYKSFSNDGIEDTYQIKQYIAKNAQPVLIGMDVYESFESDIVTKIGLVPIPNRNAEKYLGGHAITIVGYDDDKKVFIARNSWGCYDEKTEVLTKEGFKYFKDITYDDLFATINKSGELEYQNPQDIICYKYDGDMCSYKSSKVDLLVTPDHNMYIKPIHSKKDFSFVKACDLSNKFFTVKRDAVWNGVERESFQIPNILCSVNSSSCKVEVPPLEIKMDDFLEFFGYWISEGCLDKQECRRGGYEYSVLISQLKVDNRRKIKTLLDKMPFNYNETAKGFAIQNKQLYCYLEKFGYSNEKYLPSEILELSARQLKILYDALMLGDGTITKCINNSYKLAYYTTSKKLSDQFQEICLKIGYTSSIYIDDRVGQKSTGGYTYNYIGYQIRIQNSDMVAINKTKEHTLKNNNDKEKYCGNVYCVTVPNHTLFVRRNGKTCWCGNCSWGDKGYFYLSYDFITNNLAFDPWVFQK